MDRRSKGLTLIELLVVVTVVAVLAATATTAFYNSFRSRSVDLMVKNITAYLRYMQYQAIEKGLTYKLVLESESDKFLSFVREDTVHGYAWQPDSSSPRLQFPDAFNLKLDKGEEVYFYPDGRMSLNRIIVMHHEQTRAEVQIKNRIGAFRTVICG